MKLKKIRGKKQKNIFQAVFLLVCFLSLLSPGNIFSQNFTKRYWGPVALTKDHATNESNGQAPDPSGGNKIAQIPADSGFIIAGYSSNWGRGGNDVNLIRTTVNGDIIWARAIGGTGDDIPATILVTTDGGFIIGGYTNSTGVAGNYDMFLMKVISSSVTGSSAGTPTITVVWANVYGGAGNDEKALTVDATTDGGYFIGGYTKTFGQGNGDMYLVKTDVSGNLVFSKTYGHSAGFEQINSIKGTPDGGYIMVGSTTSMSHASAGSSTNPNILVLKANGVGQTTVTGSPSAEAFQMLYCTDGDDMATTVLLDGSGGYTLGGYTSTNNASAFFNATQPTWGDSPSRNVFIINLNSSGQPGSFAKGYGGGAYGIGGSGGDYSCSLIKTSSGYISVGETVVNNGGNAECYILSTDASGASPVNGSFWVGENQRGISVIQTIEGGYAFLTSKFTTPYLEVNKLNSSGTDCYGLGLTGSPAPPPSNYPATINTAKAGYKNIISNSIVVTSPATVAGPITFSVTQAIISTSLGSSPCNSTLSTLAIPALPIELVYFIGYGKGNVNLLEWKTESEINNNYFNVERSVDGEKFESISKVNGAGNSSMVLHYELTDHAPPRGICYYRLKQTDFDGKCAYSQIISLQSSEINEATYFNVFPNPAEGNTVFVKIISSEEKEIMLRVVDMMGKEIFSETVEVKKGEITIPLLPENKYPVKGIYTISASGKNFLINRKLVIR